MKVSLLKLKPPCGAFRSEPPTWIQKRLKKKSAGNCWYVLPASTLGLPPYPPFPHSVSMYAHPQYSARLSGARRVSARPPPARRPPGCPPARRPPGCPPFAGGPSCFSIYIDIDKPYVAVLYIPPYMFQLYYIIGPRYAYCMYK
jgi:hypothetical protein